MQVRHTCRVTFTIGEDYNDTICCELLPMDSGYILPGRPWMYVKNRNQGMRDNTYTFVHGGKQVTFHPKKPYLPKKGSRASATKETLRAHHVYSDNVKKNQFRGRTFFNLGE